MAGESGFFCNMRYSFVVYTANDLFQRGNFTSIRFFEYCLLCKEFICRRLSAITG